jgi:HTH-type transcriptional regulator/antitoxin HigA
MNIRPIHSEADYHAALAAIDEVIDAAEGTAAYERLDLLSILVESYEREHHPIPPPDAVEAIEFMMEQRGLTRKELEPLLGSRGRVAEILNRKRSLSMAMVRALHAELGIPAEILIRETRGSGRKASTVRGRGARTKKRA